MSPGVQKKPIDVAQFLGPKAYRVLALLPDPELRDRVVDAIATCAETLRIVDSIDLSPHELAALETPNVAAWNALAPEVRNLLVALRSTSTRLLTLFPAQGPESGADSSSFEANFGETSAGLAMDEIVRVSSSGDQDGIGEHVRLLVDVLQRDIIALGGRLRNPQVVGDRWFLLAELHQFLSQCGQCIEAIVATVLGAVTSERLDDVLPRYLSETQRAAQQRAAVADLYYRVEMFNDAISKASEEELPMYWSALIDALNDFSAVPAYKNLKPQDKRAIIMFRIFLNGWDREGSDPSRLRQEVEGFSKFLALACDMNWRDLLAEHDRRVLSSLRTTLASGTGSDVLLNLFEALYGRNQALDKHIRALRQRTPVPSAEILRVVSEMEARG